MSKTTDFGGFLSHSNLAILPRMIPDRARLLNDASPGNGPVLYWMDRDMRLHDNWALVHAMALAKERQVGIAIVYNLVVNFEGGGRRQWDFKVRALRELAELAAQKNLAFYVVTDRTGKDSPQEIVAFCKKHGIGTVVTDFSPLRIQRTWKDAVANHITCPLVEVDAHNIVPIWKASNKQEFGAYTLRPKLHKLLPEYLDDFPKLAEHPFSFPATPHHVDWEQLMKLGDGAAGPEPVDWIIPGEIAAHRAMKKFVDDGLDRYTSLRNDPNAHAQSNLSPYLHYGMISAQRIAQEIVARVGKKIDTVMHHLKNGAASDGTSLIDNTTAYLEELIVRRELSDNYCFYNAKYDSVEGFPDWAKKTHARHAKDARIYTYTYTQFRDAKTHDELWNAAQREMVRTGKMHGYLRMYWAKKIFEWTDSAEDAMRIAIRLNDAYELDGRDPNGYVGIAWSIGGVHDRAWFERPVFGQIRYMARSGCEKKFDVDEYIRNNSQDQLFA